MGIQVMMLPWLAFGHFIPFLQLSNKLAEKGHKITFLLPENSLPKIRNLNRYPNLITFHSLNIPPVDGLPAGAETTADVPDNLVPLIAVAMDRIKDQVEKLITSTKPNIVVHDFSHWLTQITKPLRIKTVYYQIGFAALVPLPLPHEVETGGPLSFPFGENITFFDRLTTVMKESDMFLIRTCREFEGRVCDSIERYYNKPICLTGPILLEEKESESESESAPLEAKWANWLNGFEQGSVVLCVFGSEFVLEEDQFQEILLGFESSGYPFLIALKPPIGSSTVEEAYPIGFEERIKGRGLVCGGWVPQQAILKHPSIGCFVNHCGASSMWESLLSDCQIVVVTAKRGDFGMLARLLVNELEAAVEVQKEENGWVSKENLSNAIKCVMDNDNEKSVLIKKNHAKWKEMLINPGFKSGYIDKLVHDFEGLVI